MLNWIKTKFTSLLNWVKSLFSSKKEEKASNVTPSEKKEAEVKPSETKAEETTVEASDSTAEADASAKTEPAAADQLAGQDATVTGTTEDFSFRGEGKAVSDESEGN